MTSAAYDAIAIPATAIAVRNRGRSVNLPLSIQAGRKYRDDGDPENDSISETTRKATALYNVVSKEFVLPDTSDNKRKVNGWITGLSDDASYNFRSYAECFVSENLIRKYIEEQAIATTKEANAEIEKWKNTETASKEKGNISIYIRKNGSDLSYLSMNDLAYLADNVSGMAKKAGLSRDADEYKPIRDALAHTALLTDEAKAKLTSVFNNIKSRIVNLLF